MTAQEQVEIVQRRERRLFDREKPLFSVDAANSEHIGISRPTILELVLERNRIPKTPKIATQRGW